MTTHPRPAGPMGTPAAGAVPTGAGPLAAALRETLPRLYGEPAEPLRLELIAALGAALERGQLELHLDGPPPPEVSPEAWPAGHRQALNGWGLVVAATALEERPEAPLVLEGGRLRWRRWHQQLEAVLAALVARATTPLQPAPSTASVERAMALAADHGLDGQQQQAVAALLRHGLVLLGGGPGTGKTSTVVQMLGAALEQNPQLRLHLAAPTGKAATRLQQAVALGAGRLDPTIAERLRQAPCTTLHRLLESTGERFARNRRHPLGLDLLVVDEVSMVDLPLMQALLEALPGPCQLVLVGDPAQLPPVGPGAVLLELHRPGRRAALADAAVQLTTPYRNNGAIARVAESLRAGGEASGASPLLAALEGLGPDDNLRWLPLPQQQLPEPALIRLRQHQSRLRSLAVALAWPLSREGTEGLLAELEACILLTPVRQGLWGVETIHRQLLGESFGRPLQQWPLGTPVLNQRNLPEQGLANGDIGVLVEHQGERLVLFPGPRTFHPARLSGAEPALALTIHKSQGSQYGEVLLLLPPSRHGDPRLLYTGLTRARRQASLITPLQLDGLPVPEDTVPSAGSPAR